MADYFGLGTITSLTSAAANSSSIYMFAQRTPQEKDKESVVCFTKGWVYAAYKDQNYMQS